MLQKYPLHAYIPPRTSSARATRQGRPETKGCDARGRVLRIRGRLACFLYTTAGAGTSKASQAFWDVDDLERACASNDGGLHYLER